MRTVSVMGTANLRTNMMDFIGFDSSIILNLSCGVLREFPGKFESSNLSRDDVSGEIGRTTRIWDL